MNKSGSLFDKQIPAAITAICPTYYLNPTPYEVEIRLEQLGGGGGVTNLQSHEQTAKGDVGWQPTRSFNSQIIALDSTEIETMRI